MELRAEPYGSSAARALTDALALELRERYGEDGAGGEPEPSAFAAPDGHFVVAYDEAGRPVACGGLARYDEREGEIRRMYVDPGARGRGLGRTILGALEDAARALGYKALRLETGDGQPEALALYARAGFEPSPAYGPYVDDPRSVCLWKRL